jgi:hypothetical protein
MSPRVVAVNGAWSVTKSERPHAEPQGPTRHGLADAPEAHHSQGRSVDVDAEQIVDAAPAPPPGTDVALSFGDPTRRRHEQRPGDVRGRLREHPRRVAHGDAAPRARLDIDVVVADAELGDDPQPRAGRIQQLVIDPVPHDEQTTAATDAPQQLITRRGGPARPDVNIARHAQERERRLHDGAAHEHPRHAPAAAHPSHHRRPMQPASQHPMRGRPR